jgi:hypothetical protein
LAGGLWIVFAVLLLAIGIVLLRGCALGLPASLTGWFIDFCPASTDPKLLAMLADERARQGALQAELDRLNGEASLKRRECELKPQPPTTPKPPDTPPKQEPPPTPTPPTGGNELKIPDKPSDVAPLKFLEGCWKSDAGVVERRTKKPIVVTYCFGADGSGTRTVVYSDGKTCKGPARAQFDGGTLTIKANPAPCPDGSSFVAETTRCKADAAGTAQCDIMSDDEQKPSVVGHRFHREPAP